MKRYSGKAYPNGVSKSRLLEIFLSYRDFGCSPDEFDFDLTAIRQAEADGTEQCYWFEDEHGRLIVADLSLADGSRACVIRSDGFELIPVNQRVFISYAKEDLSAARRLYKTLKAAGARPWLDEEELLPGQRWKIEIEAAIAESDFFVALLSSHSVAKRGYVQREIRTALDVLGKFPERDIYLIPARLDKCEPSHRTLAYIQRVDMFPNWDQGVRRILRTLGLEDT